MQLFRRIEGADPYALIIGISLAQCWDGGELEDFYRSSGIFFDRNSSYFLRITSQRHVNCPDLKRMVTMLPLETTDDMHAKQILVDARILLLTRTKPDSYSACIRSALVELKSELSLHY
jgi:hypothetical protein